MKTILLLEDNDERIAGFRKAMSSLGDDYILQVWTDAPSMVAECEAFLPTAALLLTRSRPQIQDRAPRRTPALGWTVAKFLAECRPACPVIIHSTNAERAHSMDNELRFADWITKRVGPIGTDWIETLWLRQARAFLAAHPKTLASQIGRRPRHAYGTGSTFLGWLVGRRRFWGVLLRQRHGDSTTLGAARPTGTTVVRHGRHDDGFVHRPLLETLRPH
jgi:CheY-like chemotaxis protein